MDELIEIKQYGEWQIATRPPREGRWFLAWGVHGKIQGDGPLNESLPARFEFGRTREEAEAKMKKDIDENGERFLANN